MQEYYTEDLSKFGYRERVILEAILEAWNTHGLPSDFLEVWHTLPYSGEEGFMFDLQDLDRDTLHPDDVEYLEQYDPMEA